MPTTQHRLGFHFYPDQDHYTNRDLNAWLPELEALGAHWLILEGDAQRMVPESFTRGLIEAGVQPAIHFRGPIGSVPLPDLSSQLHTYGHWGVRHVLVHDRPNQRRMWPPGQWSRPNLVERYVDILLPALLEQQAAGLIPILPPLEPGGDYWDTAFLQETLRVLARRGDRALVDSLVLACVAGAAGHGLDWGAGGPEAWPEAQPYATPATSQDHRGVRIFEWYESYGQAALGRRPSTLALWAGTPLPNAPEAYRQAVQANLHLVDWLMEGPMNSGLLSMAFGPLADLSQERDAGPLPWYDSPDRPGEMAGALKARLRKEKKSAPSTTSYHDHRYILLPTQPEAARRLDWPSLSRLAVEPRTSMGTSVDQARQAREVVLAAPADLYRAETLEQLIAAGSLILQPFTGDRPAGGPHDPHACARPAQA